MILFLLDPSITEKNKKKWGIHSDYLQVYNMIVQTLNLTLVKLNKVHEGEISIKQLSQKLELFICLWGSFFFCPFFRFPSRADWIILSRGSRISVGSLRRIYSPRTDGLEERVCK